MAFLDSIKSRARHSGWKSDDDSQWDKYNPFMRKTSRTKVVDTEKDSALGKTGEYTNSNAVAEPKEITSVGEGDSPIDSATGHYSSSMQHDGMTGRPVQRKTTSGDGSKSDEDRDEDNEEEEEVDEKAEKKKRRAKLLENNIPAVQQLRAVLFPRWITINWLLLAAPIGIALNYAKVNPLAIFIVNFIAIIPLAGILSFATEEIALRVGEVLGGLLNASFG
jgi:Ca2+:H+ antiporter